MKFIIPGEPTGRPRPRVTRNGTYTPQKTVDYQALIKYIYKGPYFEKYVKIDVVAWYGIPKSASKKNRAKMIDGEIRPAKKPDLDNILKIICDALNKVAYKDDAQIVETTIKKYYAERPRVEVEIKEI